MKLNTKNLGIRRAIERWLLSRNMRRKVFRALASEGLMVWRDFGDHQLIFNPSEAMGKMLDDYGHLNRDQTKSVIKKALSNQDRVGGVFLELGANIGTQSVYALIDFAFDRVIAVEPDPTTYQTLHSNLLLNDPDRRSTSVMVAISDAPGTALLHRSSRNTGVSTLRTEELSEVNAQPGGPDTLPSAEVRVVSGDDLLKELGIKPDELTFVWMDIEGFEAEALAGMPEILSHSPPLFMEYSPAWLTSDQRDIVERALFANYNQVTLFSTGQNLSRTQFRALQRQDDILALKT